MSNSPQIPFFAPDGTLGYVPYEQMQGALKAGGKIAVKMKAPGSEDVGYVPADKAQDALKAGAKTLPYDVEEANGGKKEGTWSAYKSDIAGVFHVPSIKEYAKDVAIRSVFSGMNPVSDFETVKNISHADDKRKLDDAGMAYRLAAAGISPIANVEGMEQAAAEGNPDAVVGHMLAGQTMAAAPLIGEGVAKGLGETAKAAGRAAFDTSQNLKPGARLIGQVGGGLAGAAPGIMSANPYTAVTGGAAGYKLGPTMMEHLLPKPPTYPGAPLPAVEDFYGAKAADLMKRETAQRILDNRSAVEARRAERLKTTKLSELVEAKTAFEKPRTNPKGIIVDPESAPPQVKRTYQSIKGPDLKKMVMEGDKGAIEEWQRRGLELPEGVGFLVEGSAANKPWRNYRK